MDIYNIANELKLSHKTIHDIPLRVTFYARVSTTREEQEGSIEHQISFFTEMIQNNHNWTFIPGYVDRIRGESASNRENFMRMIEDGKNDKFDLILTKEVSRFARNTIDSLTYTRELLRCGVGVFFQNDGICTIDTDSELRLTIMSSIAADEVRKLSERVHWGQKRSIENGRVMGNNRMYGYHKSDCKLVIDEAEAEMVRLIYQLYATGDYSTRKIEKILYERGFRSRSGTKIFHGVISGIIQNPKYKGYYCGNKVRIVDYRTKQQKFLPEEDWIIYKDETGEVVPAIVSEELWDKANAVFQERSQAIKVRGRSFKDKSPLTGKIWCGADGSAYWRTSYSNSIKMGSPIYQWVCSSKKKDGAASCKSFALMEWEVYYILSNTFKSLVDDIDTYVSEFLELLKATDPTKDVQKDILALTAKIDQCKTKKDKLLEIYMDDAISKAEFKAKNDDFNRKIEEYEGEINDLKELKSDTAMTSRKLHEIEKSIKGIYQSDDEVIPKAQLDDLIKTVLDKIEVYPDTEDSMILKIFLKTGSETSVTHSKDLRCSGHIKHMIKPQQQYIFKRNSIKRQHHEFQIRYDAEIYI